MRDTNGALEIKPSIRQSGEHNISSMLLENAISKVLNCFSVFIQTKRSVEEYSIGIRANT